MGKVASGPDHWGVYVCVCMCVKTECGLVRQLSDGLTSISVCQENNTRPSEEEEKKKGGGTAEADNAVLRCVYSSYNLHLHPRKHDAPKTWEKNSS